MTYRIVSDDRQAQAEFDRLIAMPTPKMSALLDGMLAQTYAATNLATHVLTGALKASEKVEKDKPRLHQWEGQVRFGGPSVPKNVDYAIYERARGGDHDFLQPAIDSEPEWVTAIRLGLGR